MKKKGILFLFVFVVIILVLRIQPLLLSSPLIFSFSNSYPHSRSVAKADPPPEPQAEPQAPLGGGENLLRNGNMEEGFYWKYPNHFVANDWQRWWLGEIIPEYDDVRPWRPWHYDGAHAQVYFKWGVPYTAGIFQQVTVTPCAQYQFNMYGRNHSNVYVNHHTRIGIDPWGREYGLYMTELPDDVAWSEEQTYYYEWGLHTVITESQAETITVLTYVSPDPYYTTFDTLWDAGSLFELPPSPARFSGPFIPDSNGIITAITTTTQSGSVLVTWKTSQPASSQLWYQVIDLSPLPTPNPSLTQRRYLPMVARAMSPQPVSIAKYTLYTQADAYDTTFHQTVINSLWPRQLVEFIVMVRAPGEDRCYTFYSQPVQIITP